MSGPCWRSFVRLRSSLEVLRSHVGTQLHQEVGETWLSELNRPDVERVQRLSDAFDRVYEGQ